MHARVEELEAENKRLKESRRGATEAFSKRLATLEEEIQQLKDKLESANKTIAWFQKEYFGRKTETAETLAIITEEIKVEDVPSITEPLKQEKVNGVKNQAKTMVTDAVIEAILSTGKKLLIRPVVLVTSVINLTAFYQRLMTAK